MSGSRRLQAFANAVMLAAALASAIGINLRRGRVDPTCGRGGPHDRRRIASWIVWRKIVIALVLATALTPWSARPLELTDGITIAFGLPALTLIYLSFKRLMSPRRLVSAPRGPL
jgi:hypothetical protein